jgi:hypothetical protein
MLNIGAATGSLLPRTTTHNFAYLTRLVPKFVNNFHEQFVDLGFVGKSDQSPTLDRH